jgi:integrase/recombinase XerD
MTALDVAIDDYLCIRRALGFKLKEEEQLLRSFLAYMEAADAGTVTTAHAVRWATILPDAKPVYLAKRLRAVRGFAKYPQPIDPATEIPATDLLPARGWTRPTPFIYTDAEIAALMTAAGRLQTRLGAATMRTVIGLLAVTGMRIGEATRLDRDDVDLDKGRLVIRNTKFGKSRQLPLHPSTINTLCGYLEVRDQLRPNPATAALLIGTRGGRLSRDTAERIFRLLCHRVDLRALPGCGAPRLHDIRHLADGGVMRPV